MNGPLQSRKFKRLRNSFANLCGELRLKSSDGIHVG